MQRIALIAKLKPAMEAEASKLVERGPPFDVKEIGFDRHFVFLSGDHVVFVFEGGRLDQLMHSLVREPKNVVAFKEWEPLIQGFPAVAHEVYSWERADGAADWGE